MGKLFASIIAIGVLVPALSWATPNYVAKPIIESALQRELVMRGIAPSEDEQAEIEVSVAGNILGFPISDKHSSTPIIENLALNGKTGRLSADVVFKGSDKEVRHTVSGQFYEVVELPVLKMKARSGTVILAHDIMWEKVPTDKIRGNTIRYADEMIGMQPKRYIAAGRPVESDDIMPPHLVQKGQVVKMLYNTGRIHLQTIGTAMENGIAGELVRVENTQSGKVILATVIGQQEVRVGPSLVDAHNMEVASHD